MAAKDGFYGGDSELGLQAADTRCALSRSVAQLLDTCKFLSKKCWFEAPVQLSALCAPLASNPAVSHASVFTRRAEVTLDGVWPTDKTSRCLIKSPERLAEMNYEGRLESVSRKQGARFKEYRPETGSWVFKVKVWFCS